MNVIFDLDGVLFETQDAVYKAYKEAGIDMPDSAWGKPWQSWLPKICGSMEEAELVHDKKDWAYETAISMNIVQTLPPLVLLRVLSQGSLAKVGVLTGASRCSTESLMRYGNISHVPVYGTSMTRAGKFEALSGIAARGVYIDDNDLMMPEGWRLVRFAPGNDTLADLMENLWTP
jgi:beta-phosphoglucomutase-like phosphatase (HAD superfamily)